MIVITITITIHLFQRGVEYGKYVRGESQHLFAVVIIVIAIAILMILASMVGEASRTWRTSRSAHEWHRKYGKLAISTDSYTRHISNTQANNQTYKHSTSTHKTTSMAGAPPPHPLLCMSGGRRPRPAPRLAVMCRPRENMVGVNMAPT